MRRLEEMPSDEALSAMLQKDLVALYAKISDHEDDGIARVRMLAELARAKLPDTTDSDASRRALDLLLEQIERESEDSWQTYSLMNALLARGSDAGVSDPGNRGRPRDTVPVEDADKAAALAAFDPWLPWMSMAQRAAELGPLQVHQRANAQSVLAARDRIESTNGPGDRRAMLFAIVQCIEAQLVPPPWLAAAFLEAYDTVSAAEATSWDNVFGKPYPKSTNAARLRRRRSIAIPLFDFIETARAKKRTKGVGDVIFDQAALRFAISAKQAREYYDEFKDGLDWRKPFLPISDEELKKIVNKKSSKR